MLQPTRGSTPSRGQRTERGAEAPLEEQGHVIQHHGTRSVQAEGLAGQSTGADLCDLWNLWVEQDRAGQSRLVDLL